MVCRLRGRPPPRYKIRGAPDLGVARAAISLAIAIMCSCSDQGHDALMKIFHQRHTGQIEVADAATVLALALTLQNTTCLALDAFEVAGLLKEFGQRTALRGASRFARRPTPARQFGALRNRRRRASLKAFI